MMRRILLTKTLSGSIVLRIDWKHPTDPIALNNPDQNWTMTMTAPTEQNQNWTMMTSARTEQNQNWTMMMTVPTVHSSLKTDWIMR